MKKKRKRPALVARREKEPEKREAGISESREVKAGDVVIRRPVTLEGYQDGQIHRTMKGRVAYVHPRGRFHVVEFGLLGGRVRESFPGVYREDQ